MKIFLMTSLFMLILVAENSRASNVDHFPPITGVATPVAARQLEMPIDQIVMQLNNDPVQKNPRISVVGYGATSSFDGYTVGQKRLMAMRASKLDAYRALAEQINGIRVSGSSNVSALMAQNDSFRAYVDALIRGAKVLSVTPMADGNYETVLEVAVDNLGISSSASEFTSR